MKKMLFLLSMSVLFLVAGSLQGDPIPMDSLAGLEQRAFIGALKAVQTPNKDSLDRILDTNPNFISVTDRKDANTLAHHAALRLDYLILSRLRDRGADVTLRNSHGQTVLDILQFKLVDYIKNNDNQQTVLSFVDRFPQLNTMKDDHGRTLLYMAAAWGRLPLVQALLQRGAQINEPDRASSTPLHQAVVNGHRPVVAYLSNNGGIVYGKADVMVIPSESYRAELNRAGRTIFASTRGAELFNEQDLHMSLAYVSFPLRYTENTGAYTQQADAKLLNMFRVIFNRLGTPVSGVESFQMQGMGQTFGNTVQFTSLQALGNVWAAVYTVPSHILSFFENVTTGALAAYPGTRRTYTQSAPPHIALARGANAYQGKENPDPALRKGEFVAAIRTSVFPPEATLDQLVKISIRVPAMNSLGYIERSKTWNQLDEEYSAQAHAGM